MNELSLEKENVNRAKATETSEIREEQDSGRSDKSWLLKYANDMVNISAAFALLSAALTVLLLYLRKGSPSDDNTALWMAVLVSIFIFSCVGLIFFSGRDAEFQEMNRPKGAYVLSESSLKVLRASELPADFVDFLENLLRSSKNSDSKSNIKLAIQDTTDRSADTWIGALQEELGKARVKMFEDQIFRFTWRDAG